jgi:acetyltransferase
MSAEASRFPKLRNDWPKASFGNTGSLDPIFNPKTVAFIGEVDATIGQQTLSAFLSSEFRGSTFIVQPGQSSEHGYPMYPSLAEVPSKIDLVVAIMSPEAGPLILAACVERDVRGVLLLSSGFGRKGTATASAAEHMQAVLRGSRTRVIGPNALGVMNPSIGLNATAGLQMPIGGTVAFLTESAILGRVVLDWSLKHLVGFSVFASLGSMLDVSWANVIDYFGSDPGTRAIILQISSIGDARSFISAAREVSLNKPIIVMKVGRGEDSVRAVGWKSHNVSSDDDVLTAAFDRVGVLQVDTLEDLFYAADALSKQPRPQGGRLMVVSNADGAGVIAADAVVRAGVELAQPSDETRQQLEHLLPQTDGPDDVLGDSSPESYIRAAEIAAKDANCDGLLLLMVPWALADPQRTAELLFELRKSAKPVLISYLGSSDMPSVQEVLVRACIPTFASPDVAAGVFRYIWRYSYDLQALYETPVLHADGDWAAPHFAQNLIAQARNADRTSLSPFEAGQILAKYGIPTLGHGTFRSVESSGHRAKLRSRIDPQFGPVLMFGSGDRGPHAYGDLAIGLPPLNATLARRMLERSKFYVGLLQEFRTERLPLLEDALVRFSQLVTEQPGIRDFEIDPLLISGEDLVAVGSCCALFDSHISEDELPRPAIRPYPVQYVSSWTMNNGQNVTIRPIRAEDEPLMVKFHEGLSDETIYLRYFQKVKLRTRTSHQRLSRVCFLDYDREIALVAELRDTKTGEYRIVALATLLKLPHRKDGEVAVLVSDDYHRQGLGKELIRRLVSYARDEGLRRVVAETMGGNIGMRAIFQRLGFRLAIASEEDLVSATLMVE